MPSGHIKKEKMELSKYKQGLKAYRNGFGTGLLVGIGICLFLGKAVWAIPVVLGLLFGSIAFERKIIE